MNSLKIKSFRITIDLGDERIYQLLKLEAVRKGSMKNIIHEALRLYFEDRIETLNITKAAEKTFAEWDNSLDSDYDKL